MATISMAPRPAAMFRGVPPKRVRATTDAPFSRSIAAVSGQSSEAASLNRAAESLALGGGGLLLGGIGTRIGLDEVTVEQTGDEDAAVVLGKFLAPRLFGSYGISIAEAINTIKLRYTLNERWALKAEAGLDQSADVEYKIER